MTIHYESRLCQFFTQQHTWGGRDCLRRLVLIVMLISVSGTGQVSRKSPELAAKQATALERVTKQFEIARRARYMEPACKDTIYQGWKEFPLKECVYSRKSKLPNARVGQVLGLTV
jgi:hypothetical protein